MRPRLFVAMLLLAAGFIACGDDNQTPAPSPSTVSPFLGPPKSLQVTGNLSFSFIGESRQLTATATFGGDAVRNVTSQAEWSSSNPAVATVTGGLVKVVSFGDTQITATYRGITSEKAAVSAKANAVLTSIAIAGPAEIAPGTSGQFTATGRYDDGSTKDLSSTASWRSGDSTILRSAGLGKFEALKGGGDGGQRQYSQQVHVHERACSAARNVQTERYGQGPWGNRRRPSTSRLSRATRHH